MNASYNEMLETPTSVIFADLSYSALEQNMQKKAQNNGTR